MTAHTTKYVGSEGYELIDAAFEVHGELGGVMSEEIYQENFELELGFRSMNFIPKGELKLFYKGHLLEKKHYPDLLISKEYIPHYTTYKKV